MTRTNGQRISAGGISPVPPDGMLGLVEPRAVLSPCGLYRYKLWRAASRHGSGTCLFVLLNPSTADSENDDPTLRRCIGFASAWGFARVELANLFAFRATEPDAMIAATDPVGPENDRHVLDAARSAHRVVAAWGSHGTHLGRGDAMRALLAPFAPVMFGLTKNGQPRHPLYLSASAPLSTLLLG